MTLLQKIKNKFKAAYNGWIWLNNHDTSIKIQLFIGLLVVIFFLFVEIELTDWMIVILSIGFVIVSEVFNSVIEKLCDYVQPKPDRHIKIIKDIAAAGVLFASVIAFIIGILILLKYGGAING